MATRSIESRKSRLITIAIIPFMSCAGRLPVFVLIAGAFFPRHAALALLGIYLLGIVLAILSAMVLARFVKDDDLPFVMELPPYRMPTGKAIGRHTWEKGKQYLEKMATTILLFSVLIWFLGYFPRHPDLTAAKSARAALLADSSAMPSAASADAPVIPSEAEESLPTPAAAISGSASAESLAAADDAARATLVADAVIPGSAPASLAALDARIDSLTVVQQEQSLIGRLGKAVAPALDPLGFDWRMDVGLLAGVGAKELVVSTMGVMYSQGAPAATPTAATPAAATPASDPSVIPSEAKESLPADSDDTATVAASSTETADSDDTALQAALKQSVSPAAALAFMVFVLLYFPCIATFVAIKNETGGWRWAILCAVYTIAVAWLFAFATYRLALLFFPL